MCGGDRGLLISNGLKKYHQKSGDKVEPPVSIVYTGLKLSLLDSFYNRVY
jgi:hypothetical protein